MQSNKLNVFKQFAKASTIEDLNDIQLNYIFDKMRITEIETASDV